MINRSFYLSHEQVEKKQNKREKRKHDKMIHIFKEKERETSSLVLLLSLSQSRLIVNFCWVQKTTSKFSLQGRKQELYAYFLS